MIYLDKYAYINNLKNVHPMEKFLFTILTLIIVLSSNSILLSAEVFLLMSLLIIFKAKIPFNFYIKLIMLPFYFIFAGVIAIALNKINDNQTSCFFLKIFNFKLGVTGSGMYISSKLFFKSLASISCLYFLTLTVPVVEIINILKKIKTPKLFLELMVIIYRFIFVLLETSDKIKASQSSRLGYKNVLSSFKSLGKLFGSLFIISFKKSEEIFYALESRSFNGEFNFLTKNYCFSPINIILILSIDSLLIVSNFLSWPKL